MTLHLQAAEGYLNTGISVALDNSQDDLIVREAGAFWRELGMRAKIDPAVAEVKEEVKAGRLGWNVKDVQRVIRPYPKRGRVDAILERQGDDTWCPEGERPYAGDKQDEHDSADEAWSDVDAEDEAEYHSDEGEAEARVDEGEAEAKHSPGEQGDARSSGRSDGTPAVAGADCAVAVSAAHADPIAHSAHLIATYESAISSLKACGAMKPVINLQNDILKERRRMRSLGKQDPDVLLALSRQRDEEAARERKRRRVIADANAQTLNAAKLRRSIEDANATLKRRRAECMDAENIWEMKHSMKNFTLEDLGHGRSRGGGQQGGSSGSKYWVVYLASARVCQERKGTTSAGGRTTGTRRCSKSTGRLGLASSLNGSSACSKMPRTALGTRSPFLFTPKRVVALTGRSRCRSPSMPFGRSCGWASAAVAVAQ